MAIPNIPTVSNVESEDVTYEIDLKDNYWNLKSYTNSINTYSPAIFSEIPNCTALSGKHDTSGYWYTYWPSLGLIENWTIKPGDGLFILTDDDGTWNITLDINGSGNGTVESFTRGFTYVIASNETSEAGKNESNYICDGTDDDLIINEAIQNMTRGTIKLLYGYYNISSPIVIDRFVNIIGDGVGSTIIYLQSGSNCRMIEYNLSSGYNRGPLMYLAHFMLDGNKQGQSSGTDAIHTMVGDVQAKDWSMYDVWIDSYRGNGTHIVTTHNWVIYHTAIERCDGAGIYVASTGGGTIRDNLLAYNKDGIFISGVGNKLDIIANDISYNDESGIHVGGTSSFLYIAFNEVENNNVDVGTHYGLQLENTHSSVVIGNTISGSNQRDAIIIWGSVCKWNRIIANKIDGASRYGILLAGNNHTVRDNTILNTVSDPISDSSVNSYVINNIGFKTENYGTTSSGTDIQVNHGLAGTPDYVILTPLGETNYSYVHSKTSTTFNITSESSVSFDWYAKYKP